YLRAVQLSRRLTAGTLTQSDALYRQALAIDPRYAPAWVGLSYNAGSEYAFFALLSRDQGAGGAREAAEKARAIDPELAPAHAALGMYAMFVENDLAESARHFERALALDPADPEVLLSASVLLAHIGRLDESLAIRESVVRRDPLNVIPL